MDSIIELLTHGEIDIDGLLPWGSNYTFMAHIYYQDNRCDAVYKPRKGERPLWDFPQGTLYQREYAAYLVSDALQWGIVPPTIIRHSIHGEGSLQYYIDHDSDQHYFTLQGRFLAQSKRIALFDILINNADRKSGHVLIDEDDRLWSIDHGVCFHTEYKLRTVIWDFVGDKLPANLLDDLIKLQTQLEEPSSPLRQNLKGILSSKEVMAMHQRNRHLIQTAVFPEPGPGRPYPWPTV